ncbi:MAG: hypothetical protein QXM53_00795 [Thermofilaceae archaeon]
MKPSEIQAWVDRLASDTLAIDIEGTEIRLGRITLRDSLLIDLETGRNPLFEVMDVQAMQAGKHPPFSLEIQTLIFYYSLLKHYPDISREEAGYLFTLLTPDQRQRIVFWALTGFYEEDRPYRFSEAGKPVFNIPAWLPLLAHLYPGYTIRDLLELDATELMMLLSGVAEVQKFYALLIAGKKSKVKLAQPLIVMYPAHLKEVAHGQRRAVKGANREGKAAKQNVPDS